MNRETEDLAQNMAPPSGPSVDLVKMAWGHRWLLLLGLAAGCGGGYFYFTKQPPVYMSSARIQVVEPYSRDIPVQGVDTQSVNSRSLADEAMVMRSEKVLMEAADLGDLSSLPSFSGAPKESIAARLAGSVSIRGVGGGPSSSIFEVSYSAGDPKTTERVVLATIDAYAKHLQMQHKNVGDETVKLIQQAHGELLERLEKLEADFDKFQSTSALMFRSGRSTSIHRDNADRFLSQRQSLLVRKAQLDSMLTAAREALNSGDEPEAVLMALQGSSAASPSLHRLVNDASNGEIEKIKADARKTRSEQMRESTLFPLQIKERELLQAFDEGHPTLKTLRTRMSMIEEAIREIEQEESEFQSKLDKAMADAKASSPEEITPESVIMSRIRLTILALRQQQKIVDQEMEVMTQAYEQEIEAARAEGATEIEYARFQRDIGRQQALYDRVVARLDEINLMANAEGLRVEKLDSPKLGWQVGPSLSKSFMMGGFIGFLVAAGLAYLIDVSDKSYHSAEQIAEHLKLPVIGHVPSVTVDKKTVRESDSGLDPCLVTYFKSRSKNSEAFKAIRTALYFSNQGGDQKILQVTSAVPSDGKSTVAANCAIAIAQSGKSVLLIDSDMRRPRVHKLFGIKPEKGLAWILENIPRGASPADAHELMGEAIFESEVPNLSVMGAGTRPDNPSELLSSSQFDCLLAAAREKFDIVIVDSPPLLAVTDPSNVAPRVDGVILVVRVRKNVKPLAAQAARMLETLEANVLGVVVNGVGSREARGYGKYGAVDGYYNRGSYYKYGYGYSYGYSYNYGNKYNEYYEEGSKKGKRRSKSKAKVS